MLAKLLKRKESRQSVVESSTTENGQQQQQPLLQYRYQRPDLIGKVRGSPKQLPDILKGKSTLFTPCLKITNEYIRMKILIC